MDFPKSVPNIGLVGGKFVDEDQLTGTPGSLIPSAWGNSITAEVLNVIAAAGLAPDEADLTQLLKAIRGISGGVVGSNRNVKMTVVSPSASATLTADQLYVSTALAGQAFRLASFNKSINLATTGAGGMDTGTAPVSGYVAIYAIYNPVTGVSALLAVNATSTLAPEVYGGANMPSGYTASALVSVWPTNASSLFVIGAQYDRSVGITPIAILTSVATSVPWTPLSSAVAVPRNAKSMSGFTSATATSGAGGYLLGLAALVNGAGAQIGEGYTAPASSVFSSFSDVQMPTPQVIHYQIAVTGTVSAISGQIVVTGYKF